MTAQLTDIGPAASNFAGYHNLVLKDTYYIGSRTAEPARVVGYHLPTGQTSLVRDFPGFREVSALVADGDLLYIAVLDNRKRTRIFTWDTVTHQVEPVTDVPRITIWALKLAGEGLLYAVGDGIPSLHEIDLRTGASRVLFTPDSRMTQPPTIAVSPDRVFFGTGGQAVGENNVRARLFEIDRHSGSVTSILPPELADDLCVVGLLLIADRLYIGTKADDHPAHFAIMSLPGRTLEFIGQPAGPTGLWALLETGEDISFFSTTKVYSYRPGPRDIIELADFGGALAGGLQYANGEVLAMAWPMPWPAGPPKTILHRYDRASGRLRTCAIAELDRPVRAEPVHAITAGGGRVYAAAWDLDQHDLGARTVTKVLGMPRMIKAMVVAAGGAASGRLFAAVYDAGQLWSYDPDSGHIQQVGAFPDGHNRPWDIAWDGANDLIVVGVEAGRLGGGSLSVYDPATGRMRSYTDPCGPGEGVHVVAAGDGLVFLAGAMGARGSGHLTCWDPVTGEQLWASAAVPGEAISALAYGNGLLYGITCPGTFFVFDIKAGEAVHRAPAGPDVWSGPGKLAWVDSSRIYGACCHAVIKIDPRTFQLTTLATGLGGQWVGARASLAIGTAGEIYTVRQRTLTCVREP